jgi:hypothetical protein
MVGIQASRRNTELGKNTIYCLSKLHNLTLFYVLNHVLNPQDWQGSVLGTIVVVGIVIL